MGAFSGGLTFRQYYLPEPLSPGWRADVEAGLARFAFREIDVNSEADRSLGWCSAIFPLDVELDTEMWDRGEYLVFAMRVDTLTVPGPLLRIYAEAEARRVMAEQGRESLSRYERAEIKERVKLELRKRALPSIKSIDVVWDWNRGRVRFFAANEKTNQEFIELFVESFGHLPVPDTAYTAALHGGLGLDEAALARIERIEPEPFVDTAVASAAMLEV